jgi:hypothetical protein
MAQGHRSGVSSDASRNLLHASLSNVTEPDKAIPCSVGLANQTRRPSPASPEGYGEPAGNCGSGLSHIGADHPKITCGADRMLTQFVQDDVID